MKRLTLAAVAISSLLLSCEREDLSAYVGNALTDEVTDITSVSFMLHASFTFDGGAATSSQVGFFLDDEPGITSGKYDVITDLAPISNGGKRYNFKFSNIGSDNKKIYPAGTTVYCRSFIKVEDTDFSTYQYVMGDEVSFTVPETEYTVMVYGVGGGNLDAQNLQALIVPMLMKGTNGTVEATFMYKQSEQYQSSDYKFQGVNRWILPLEGDFSEIWDDSRIKEGKYVQYASNLIATFSENVGSASMDMSDPTAIAGFIDWSIQTCPAKNYILLMKNHGGGWDFYDDKPATKAQIFDDNTGKCIPISNFVKGIEASSLGGKLKAVILDECLMATMENLGEISRVAECAMAAEEVTYSLDGEKLLSILESGILSGKTAFAMLSDVVDDYVSTYSDGGYTDHGVYNLENIDGLFSTVNDITGFLKSKYSSSDDWKVAICSGIGDALWASDYSGIYMKSTRILINELREKVKAWETLTDDEKDAAIEGIAEINKYSHYEFCFYDFVDRCIFFAEEYQQMAADPVAFGQEINQLKNLKSAYSTALRGMSYIACTKPESSDTPYEYTSISVTLQSLHPSVFKPVSKSNIFGYPKADKISLSDALAVYRDLEFDKSTSWSEFLEMIAVSGTPFFNPDREYRQTGE